MRRTWTAAASPPYPALAVSLRLMATRPTEKPAEESADGQPTSRRGASRRTCTATSPRSSGPTTSACSPTPGSRSSALYDEDDVAPGLEERLGEPGEYPFTRGIHEGMYRDRLWTMRQYAGFATPRGHQRALPLPDRARLDRPLDGLRPADPARPRLRRPALRRRGRPHRGPDRHDRGHADLLRRDPARRGLDLDDDQRPGGDPAAALRAGRRGAGRRRPRSCAARSRTTCSRSTWRAATTSTRPSRRCG